MITTDGLHGIVGLVGDKDTPADFTYIAFGSGTTAVDAGDKILETETMRAVATVTKKSILKPNDTDSYVYDFVPSADGTATEVGLFTASSGGTMLLRELLSPEVTYTKGETLTVSAEVTVKNYACEKGATW